ncbi:triacylglycerol lipase [Calothrix sp. UHCC 0171]|uniref:esterase/lipase family protein n=1 Tax=Calothrix sp. UHCC 0171 TaxID=3110245 RepID=UPI002B1FAF23|nr:triacylglycerol lipase [Calothrix sp. UHCC 0171]MEA5570910.1 triacylglycerol lipase [Calothrix sp. UHCC 0171]
MEIEKPKLHNQTNQNQLVLVHGINDTGAVFDKMATFLRNQGWLVHTLDLVPNNGDVGLDKLAQQLGKYIAINFPEEQAIDIIAFSMGGIVSRYYIQRLGGIKRVQRFITISSPHYGTVMAYASQRPGCVQMRPDSLFLKDLNADVNILRQINFTSIWTPYDLMIVPATSSQMSFGREVIVPALIHPWMLTDIRTMKTVVEALGEAFIIRNTHSS